MAVFGTLQTDKDWRFAAHAMRGTAAAIGALEVASLATLMEEQGMPEATEACAARVTAMSEAVERYLAAVSYLFQMQGAAA